MDWEESNGKNLRSRRAPLSKKDDFVEAQKTMPRNLVSPGNLFQRNGFLLWAFVLTFRVANALVVDTYFNPDEFWQGPEIAHNIVFGYGHLSWEWKLNAKLRGATHPLVLFGLPYKVLQIFGLDSPLAVTYSPRIVQGLLAGVCDIYIYKLALKLFSNKDIANFALFCSICSWFHFYCLVRTFSNSVEAVLTVVSLYYWPNPFSPSNADENYAYLSNSESGATNVGNKVLARQSITRVWGLFWCGACVTMRPTSAVLWVYVGLSEIYRLGCWEETSRMIVFEVFPAMVFWLGVSFSVDWWFYGEWTNVLFNFFDFNFVKGLDKLYGTHPFYWYFTEGFTANTAFFLPIYFFAIYKTVYEPSPSLKLQMKYFHGLVLFTLFAFSFGGHKEFRFILPLLPLVFVQCGYGLFHLRNVTSKKSFGALLALLVLSNALLGGYVSIYHQSSPTKILRFLRNEKHESDDGNIAGRQLKSVHFLMPCHSTPYYSHLHQNIPMWFIDCSPPHMITPKRPKQQIKYFEENPLKFAYDIYFNNKDKDIVAKQDNQREQEKLVVVTWFHRHLPSHIVTFDTYEKKLMPFFYENGYTKVANFFHSHIKGDVDSNEHFQYASVWHRE